VCKRSKVYWLALLVLGMFVLGLSLVGCGGGGGGSFTPTPSISQQNLGNGGDAGLGNQNESVQPGDQTPQENQNLPVDEITPPELAKSASEIGGIVADVEGNPVGELELYLDSIDNFVSSTDENGQFLIAGVTPGEHSVIVGVEGVQVASFTVATDGTAPVNTILTPSVKLTSAEGDTGSLGGRVTDLQDNPSVGV